MTQESEVRPGEEQRGTDQPKWESPLPSDAVEALRKPLDPDRIRKREGRGSTKLDYLAGHDVKRRANELFGFGNWGYTLEELSEEEAVEVKSRDGQKEGWHIAYRARVRVEVRGCLPFSDVGYGDGVEYGQASKAQARELAMKEATTDGMKRAFTGWGDQFGLILYAKADEKRLIESAAAADVPAARDEDIAELRELAQTVAGLTGAQVEAKINSQIAYDGSLTEPYVRDQISKLKRLQGEKAASLPPS